MIGATTHFSRRVMSGMPSTSGPTGLGPVATFWYITRM